MKKYLFGVLLAGAFGTAQAGFINPSFESGLTGWTGTASTATTMTTANGDVYSATDGGEFAVITADAFTNTLTSSSFMGSSGQTLSFDWLFSAMDYLPFNDNGSFSLMLGTTSIASGILGDVLGVGDWGNTGWMTESIILSSTGMYTLAFSVTNLIDTLYDSQMYVDNIQLSALTSVPGRPTRPTASIPEPTSLALMAMGLAGLGFTSRRKLRKKELSA